MSDRAVKMRDRAQSKVKGELMTINTDRLDRRIEATDKLCPYPSSCKDWVIWRIGFRHGSSEMIMSRNGTSSYYDGYKSGDDWARADKKTYPIAQLK